MVPAPALSEPYVAYDQIVTLCPAQTTGLNVTEVEDGLVVFVPSTRRAHHLNVTATLVFELCTGDNSQTSIIDLVQSAFELVAPPVTEVAALIESFRAELLVT